MIIWLIIALSLVFLAIFEQWMGFPAPYPVLRHVVLFLVILGMAWRARVMEKGSEKEALQEKIKELENKLREKETA